AGDVGHVEDALADQAGGVQQQVHQDIALVGGVVQRVGAAAAVDLAGQAAARLKLEGITGGAPGQVLDGCEGDFSVQVPGVGTGDLPAVGGIRPLQRMVAAAAVELEGRCADQVVNAEDVIGGTGEDRNRSRRIERQANSSSERERIGHQAVHEVTEGRI